MLFLLLKLRYKKIISQARRQAYSEARRTFASAVQETDPALL